MKNNEMRTNNWLIDGISEEQFQTEKILAVIGANINLKRLEMGMDQKLFAKFMGVSQGMVSRWESGSYNFSVSTLSSICQKLDLTLNVDIKSELAEKEKMFFVVKKTSGNNDWQAWMPNKDDVIIGGVA